MIATLGWKTPRCKLLLIEKDRQVYHDDNPKVNAFSEQFFSVFTDECLENIPIDKGDTRMHSKLTSIDLAKDDNLKYLQDLKTNKACGPDEISTIVLKEAATE